MSIQTIKSGNLEYLVAEGISAPHAFTTRYGGVSVGTQDSLNLAIGRGDSPGNVEANLRILAKELDVPAYRNIGLAVKNKETVSIAVKRFMEYIGYR